MSVFAPLDALLRNFAGVESTGGEVLTGVAADAAFLTRVFRGAISAPRTEEYLAERVAMGCHQRALRILTRAGKGAHAMRAARSFPTGS